MEQRLHVWDCITYGWKQANNEFGKWVKVLLISAGLLMLSGILQTIVAPQGDQGFEAFQMALQGTMGEISTERAERFQQALTEMDASSREELSATEREELQEKIDQQLAQEYNLSAFQTTITPTSTFRTAVSYLINYLFATLIMLGIITCALHVIKGLDRGWRTYFAEKDRFLDLFLGYVLYNVGVVIGFFLLIIPGIIISVRWSYYSYLIIDKGLGPIAALKESWQLTRGHFWQLLGLILLTALVVAIGALLFGIGLLRAVPTAALAVAYYYQHLLEEEVPETDEEEDGALEAQVE